MSKSRITKAAKRRRVYKVVGWLLDGLSRSDILQLVSDETNWGVSERQIEYYIADATAIIDVENKKTFEQKKAEAEKRLKRWMAKAIANHDLRIARRLHKDWIELHGLDAPRKIAPTDPAGEKEYQPFRDADDNQLHDIVVAARQILANAEASDNGRNGSK